MIKKIILVTVSFLLAFAIYARYYGWSESRRVALANCMIEAGAEERTTQMEEELNECISRIPTWRSFLRDLFLLEG